MKKYLFILLIISAVLVSNLVSAATYTASSCSQSNVQSAVNASSPGDVVNIPAGNCTWSSAVSVTKGITIQGAGNGSTVITANSTIVFNVQVTSGNVRITGFGFTGSGAARSLTSGVIIASGLQGVGIFNSFRIDHCQFTNIGSFNVVIGEWWDITDNPTVLIDHVTYTGNGATMFAKFFGINDSWKQADQYGTSKAVYVEDSTFNWPDGSVGAVMDTEHGARVVVRHCTVTNGNLQMHDTGSTQGSRGNRLFEFYNNTIGCNSTNSACQNNAGIGLRGGTGVVYSNTISNKFFAAGFTEIYRAVYSNSWLGGACGSSSGNMCDTSTLYHCDNAPHLQCSYAGDSVCGGGNCIVSCSSNIGCPSGVACVSIDGPSGYPCRDQVGWGQEDANGQNQISPIYWWSNVDQNGGAVYIGNSYSQIQQNREFCYHDPSTTCGSKAGWSYTPYSYPHPLTNGTILQPPTNLKIVNP